MNENHDPHADQSHDHESHGDLVGQESPSSAPDESVGSTADGADDESPDAAADESPKPQLKRISVKQTMKMLEGGGVTGKRAESVVRDTLKHMDGVLQFNGVRVRIDPELDADEASGDEGEYPDGSVVGAGGGVG